jgi:predicted transcriptional regulator
MVHNSEKLALATRYRQQGYSYTEIAAIVGVSKATVSNWLAKKPFSKRVRVENTARAGRANAKRLSLLNKAKAKEREKRYQTALKTARTEYRHYKSHPLFVAGLTVYMCTGGHKDKHVVRLSSVSSPLHRIFQTFAEQFLGVTKDHIRFWLLLYPTHVEKQCYEHWATALRLPPTYWYKHQVIESTKRDQS